ncbi:defensin [Drosophila ficusphila]|uniref:defensin n=1 Tax=Drosophila ficusphila TaxID=30025 RepID=UPI0007E6214A|nr:defensin [Drosophila ficusphila]
MKIFALLAFAMVLMACMVQAQPVAVVENYPAGSLLDIQDAHQQVVQHSRQKRATCDLLSKWNWNHTACAAHCVARRFKGGYCNDKAVCVCRK